ncbi:MAG: hypothetical protein LBT40_02075 [Deltaproteobacteria bacterium]|nr:hypothetical protein [Deltaproteobacteria bacterium]
MGGTSAPEPAPVGGRAVGIDMGIVRFVTWSDASRHDMSPETAAELAGEEERWWDFQREADRKCRAARRKAEAEREARNGRGGPGYSSAGG